MHTHSLTVLSKHYYNCSINQSAPVKNAPEPTSRCAAAAAEWPYKCLLPYAVQESKNYFKV